MKNAFVLLAAFFFFLNSSTAQEVDETKDYVYTVTNKLVHADLVKYKSRFLATNYILVDSIKYSPSKVKFYKNTEGFFANTKFFHGYGSSAFAKRVSKGKINLFNKEVTSYTPMGSTMPMGGGFGLGFGMPVTNTIQYYNKGFENLKRAKYKNLAVDLADNPKSMEFLNKYKKRRNTSTAFFVAGGVVALTGLIGFISKTSNTAGKPERDTTINTVAMISGVSSAMVGSLISMGNKNNIEDAIDEYNRK